MSWSARHGRSVSTCPPARSARWWTSISQRARQPSPSGNVSANAPVGGGLRGHGRRSRGGGRGSRGGGRGSRGGWSGRVVVVGGAAVVVGRPRRRGNRGQPGGRRRRRRAGRPRPTTRTYRRLRVVPLLFQPSRHTVGTVHPPTLTPSGVTTRWMLVPVRVYSSQQSVAAASTSPPAAELATAKVVALRATTAGRLPATSTSRAR